MLITTASQLEALVANDIPFLSVNIGRLQPAGPEPSHLAWFFRQVHGKWIVSD